MASAVPLGASTLWRWWVSMISMSQPSLSERAAWAKRPSITFTPTAMFAAITMGSLRACSAMRAFWALSKPVVPMTAATPMRAQTSKWASVPSGRVKSISTCAPCRPCARSAAMFTPLMRPSGAAASWPSAALVAMSSAPLSVNAGLPSTASMSMRPMRPEAPATATRTWLTCGFSRLSCWVPAAGTRARHPPARAPARRARAAPARHCARRR